MKQDHLHPPSVSTTPPRTCGSPPFVSTTTPHPCGTPFRLNDTTAHLRSTHLSHRHHRAFAVHSVRFHDIAVHLRFTCFVSTTSLRICGSPISSLQRPSIVSTTSLRPCSPPICLTDIAAHLRLTHFVSTTSPHPCDTLFRLYDHLHPLCLTDIAVHLRFTHCLTDTAHLRFILFGLYDFTPHHSTSTFYLSGISRTRGSVRLFVIALACPKVVRLYRTYLRIRTVV
jgi:hypothetical protein